MSFVLIEADADWAKIVSNMRTNKLVVPQLLSPSVLQFIVDIQIC
jgi:hypothetical protein